MAPYKSICVLKKILMICPWHMKDKPKLLVIKKKLFYNKSHKNHIKSNRYVNKTYNAIVHRIKIF